MNLQPINPPLRKGQRVQCSECGHMSPDCLADMDTTGRFLCSMCRGARVTIGDVGFIEPGQNRPYNVMGHERVELLRLAYRQELCRYVPCDLRQGNGYRHLAWSEIRWDTAGERVTGDS